jgi:hypothetical protein
MNNSKRAQAPYGLHFVRVDEHMFQVKHLYPYARLAPPTSNDADAKDPSQQNPDGHSADRVARGRNDYISLDSRAAHLWTDTGRELHRICYPKSSCGFITCLAYIAKSRLLIASAINMRLMVYDRDLNYCGAAVHTERTFSSICFDDHASRLATSE